MSRTHELKTWPEPFQAVWDRRKHYEVRKDDRGFGLGDILKLLEWDPAAWGGSSVTRKGDYTGRSIDVIVTYVTPGGAWGLPADLCIMSIARLTREGIDERP